MLLHFSDGFEQVMPEPVVAHRAVVTFDIGVLLRIARLDMFQADAVLFDPEYKLAADVLRPVIAANRLWLPRHSMT